VPAGATAVLQLRLGGAPGEIGDTVAAELTQAGPFTGTARGTNVAGVPWAAGMILVHLAGAISDASRPFELQNVRIEIGSDE
jgi:hypothetical protein